MEYAVTGIKVFFFLYFINYIKMFEDYLNLISDYSVLVKKYIMNLDKEEQISKFKLHVGVCVTRTEFIIDLK
jgi:hypothetical protein